MSIIRRNNWLGQQRVDLPHLRSIESAVSNDFDALAGTIMTGQKALVIAGFEVSGTLTDPAVQLQLNVAGGAIMHPLASESGTVFSVPADTAAETLDALNVNVDGSFVPSQTNYIGLDLVRGVDDSTSDLVMFIDANTGLETPKTVPLARTLRYRISISTVDFSASPNILPVAEVLTNSQNQVTAIVDSRQLFFRLGSGGSIPDSTHSYPWVQGRDEAASVSKFQGGDKAVSSLKDFSDALMTRLWEVGGGEYWYSNTSDKDTKLTFSSTDVLGSNDDNFFWDSGTSTLYWAGLSLAFANSTARTNTIAGSGPGGGSAVIPDGFCIYVDANRFVDGATISIPAAVDRRLVGSGAIPGSRYVIAWRIGADVFIRNQVFNVGRPSKVAGAYAGANGLGVVRLSGATDNSETGTPLTPTVVPLNAAGSASYENLTSSQAAYIGIGSGSGYGVEGFGGPSGGGGVHGVSGGGGPGVFGFADGGGSGVYGSSTVIGVSGVGTSGGMGVNGIGSAAASGGEFLGGNTDGSAGVYGTSQAINGVGVHGLGKGTGSGGVFLGGGTDGTGVVGTGGATDGKGVNGIGTGLGSGGEFVGGNSDTSSGVFASTAATNGVGIHGLGKGTGSGGVFMGGNTNAAGAVGAGAVGSSGSGLEGTGGTANGVGVLGTGGATNGIGVKGLGTGTGAGVWGSGTVSGVYGEGSVNGNGVRGVGAGSGAGVRGEGTVAGSGDGVYGIGGTSDGIGVHGQGTGTGAGVQGNSTASFGVFGSSNSSAGVKGQSSTGVGVLGLGGSLFYGVQGTGGGNGSTATLSTGAAAGPSVGGIFEGGIGAFGGEGLWSRGQGIGFDGKGRAGVVGGGFDIVVGDQHGGVGVKGFGGLVSSSTVRNGGSGVYGLGGDITTGGDATTFLAGYGGEFTGGSIGASVTAGSGVAGTGVTGTGGNAGATAGSGVATRSGGNGASVLGSVGQFSTDTLAGTGGRGALATGGAGGDAGGGGTNGKGGAGLEVVAGAAGSGAGAAGVKGSDILLSGDKAYLEFKSTGAAVGNNLGNFYTLARQNMVRAWARIKVVFNGVGPNPTVSILGGHNIASVSVVDANTLRLTWGVTLPAATSLGVDYSLSFNALSLAGTMAAGNIGGRTLGWTISGVTMDTVFIDTSGTAFDYTLVATGNTDLQIYIALYSID